MGKLLADWDYVDSPEQAAPTVFQAIYREFALLTFADELGEDLAQLMLKSWGFWQERLLQMVTDLADPDKIMAVLPGGVTGRLLDPHTTDQLASFMNGGKMYWWFSDKAIEEHTQDTLTLNPQ
jgi:hypothetical protein